MAHNNTYDYKLLCQDVCEVARAAGAYIAAQREIFSSSDIEYKGVNNLVSYVDKQAEVMIVERLLALLPGSGVLAEEGTGAANCGTNLSTTTAGDVTTGDGMTWIIDPLDGTTNFMHGMPPYAVSIALFDERSKRVVVGVVYEITGQECYYAWAGSAAYCNGREIRCSSVGRLEDALIISGLAYNMSDSQIGDFVALFDHFNRTTHGARRLGSAATDLVYVAAGRAEAFYQANLSPWDVAAGALIVEGAGGCVSDFEGGDDYVFGRQIVATNRGVRDEFVRQLKGTSKN